MIWKGILACFSWPHLESFIHSGIMHNQGSCMQDEISWAVKLSSFRPCCVKVGSSACDNVRVRVSRHNPTPTPYYSPTCYLKAQTGLVQSSSGSTCKSILKWVRGSYSAPLCTNVLRYKLYDPWWLDSGKWSDTPNFITIPKEILSGLLLTHQHSELRAPEADLCGYKPARDKNWICIPTHLQPS